MYTSFNLLNCEQFETFTPDPTSRDNLARVRVTIGNLRPVVVAIVPVLADTPFRGAKGHYARCFELDFIPAHLFSPVTVLLKYTRERQLLITSIEWTSPSVK